MGVGEDGKSVEESGRGRKRREFWVVTYSTVGQTVPNRI